MKVSIITVAYNAQATIEDTLMSVANQDYYNVEYIVVDGGSNDKTAEIVSKHKNVSKFLSEPDDGIYDAMNKGLNLASGEIIGVLNADDIYAHHNVISLVVKFMKCHKLDLLYGDVSFFRNGNPDISIRRYKSSNFKASKLAWGWMPAHPAMFFHKRVFNVVGNYKTDYKIAGDFEYIARVFSHMNLKYIYIPEVLVKMMIGGVSTKGIKNTIILNKEVLRACKENGIYTNIFMILSKYPAKIWEVINI